MAEEYRCKKCDRDFSSEDGLTQHNLARHRQPVRYGSKSRFKIYALLLVAVIVLGIFGISYAMMTQAHSGGPFHWHPQLTVTINGGIRVVPAQIGIEAALWKSHELDQYGSMQPMPWMGMPGMSPLHTHDPSGTIHMESAVNREYALQDFLDVWGVSISQSEVIGHQVDPSHRAYIIVDGIEKSVTERIVLRDGQQIQTICGP